MTRVAGAVLAAGASARLGQPKQLVAVGGRPLVRVIAAELIASTCNDVAVVVGAHAPEVTRALDGVAVRVLANAEWTEGMASSVRCAAAWASPGHDVLLLATCDQPLLSAAHVDALVTRCARLGRPVGSRYEGVVGVPAAFDRGSFERLLQVSGDEGARRILRGGVVAAVDWPEGAVDIDTAADLARATDRSIAGP